MGRRHADSAGTPTQPVRGGHAHRLSRRDLIVLPVLTIAAALVLRPKLGPSYRRQLDRMATQQPLLNQSHTEETR